MHMKFNTFNDLYSYLITCTNGYIGNTFEIFANFYFNCEQIKKLYNIKKYIMYPDLESIIKLKLTLPIKDYGIDGIIFTNDDKMIPVQVKFRHQLTLGISEIATFGAILNKRFDLGILFTNCTRCDDIKKYIKGIEIINDFPKNIEFWNTFSELDYFKIKQKKDLDFKLEKYLADYKKINYKNDIKIMCHDVVVPDFINSILDDKKNNLILIMCRSKDLLWNIVSKLEKYVPLLFGINDKKISLRKCLTSNRFKALESFIKKKNKRIIISTYIYSPLIRASSLITGVKFDEIILCDYTDICRSRNLCEKEIIGSKINKLITNKVIKIDCNFNFTIDMIIDVIPKCNFIINQITNSNNLIKRDEFKILSNQEKNHILLLEGIKMFKDKSILILNNDIDENVIFYNKFKKTLKDIDIKLIVKKNYSDSSEIRDVCEKKIIIGNNLLQTSLDISEFDIFVIFSNININKLICKASFPNNKNKIILISKYYGKIGYEPLKSMKLLKFDEI